MYKFKFQRIPSKKSYLLRFNATTVIITIPEFLWMGFEIINVYSKEISNTNFSYWMYHNKRI